MSIYDICVVYVLKSSIIHFYMTVYYYFPTSFHPLGLATYHAFYDLCVCVFVLLHNDDVVESTTSRPLHTVGTTVAEEAVG